MVGYPRTADTGFTIPRSHEIVDYSYVRDLRHDSQLRRMWANKCRSRAESLRKLPVPKIAFEDYRCELTNRVKYYQNKIKHKNN